MEEKTLEEISASVTRYYDSLTDEEVTENRAWGEFAATQFAREECSEGDRVGVIDEPTA